MSDEDTEANKEIVALFIDGFGAAGSRSTDTS